MRKRLQKLHEIVDSPEYEGQAIHLKDGSYSDARTLFYEDDGTGKEQPITVFLGTRISECPFPLRYIAYILRASTKTESMPQSMSTNFMSRR